MADSLYTDSNSEYLKNTISWHTEDSPWKARQIFNLLTANNVSPQHVVEVGCGAGEILVQLDKLIDRKDVVYEGYEIAGDAYSMTKSRTSNNLSYFNVKPTSVMETSADVLLMIDVFEHVDDYISFIREHGKLAHYKVYHIPLELTVSSVLRNSVNHSRFSVGHLHYFMKDTALDTIRHAGQEIVDYKYTAGAIETSNKSIKTRFANVFRRMLFSVNQDLAVRFFGGYSLIVLAK